MHEAVKLVTEKEFACLGFMMAAPETVAAVKRALATVVDFMMSDEIVMVIIIILVVM